MTPYSNMTAQDHEKSPAVAQVSKSGPILTEPRGPAAILRAGISQLTWSEVLIGVTVLALLAVAGWIWYRGAVHTLDLGTLSLFEAEGTFLFTVTAILVIVFELRKEKRDA